MSGAAAIGCVGWLSHKAIVSALLRLDACCIVVSNPDRDEPAQQRLLRKGKGLPAQALPALAPHPDAAFRHSANYAPRSFPRLRSVT